MVLLGRLEKASSRRLGLVGGLHGWRCALLGVAVGRLLLIRHVFGSSIFVAVPPNR
jgi:hypothetical protein